MHRKMLLLQPILSNQCSFASYMCVNCQVPGKDLDSIAHRKATQENFLEKIEGVLLLGF